MLGDDGTRVGGVMGPSVPRGLPLRVNKAAALSPPLPPASASGAVFDLEQLVQRPVVNPEAGTWQGLLRNDRTKRSILEERRAQTWKALHLKKAAKAVAAALSPGGGGGGSPLSRASPWDALSPAASALQASARPRFNLNIKSGGGALGKPVEMLAGPGASTAGQWSAGLRGADSPLKLLTSASPRRAARISPSEVVALIATLSSSAHGEGGGVRGLSPLAASLGALPPPPAAAPATSPAAAAAPVSPAALFGRASPLLPSLGAPPPPTAMSQGAHPLAGSSRPYALALRSAGLLPGGGAGGSPGSRAQVEATGDLINRAEAALSGMANPNRSASEVAAAGAMAPPPSADAAALAGAVKLPPTLAIEFEKIASELAMAAGET